MSAQLSGQPELRLPVTHWQPRGRLAAWAWRSNVRGVRGVGGVGEWRSGLVAQVQCWIRAPDSS